MREAVAPVSDPNLGVPVMMDNPLRLVLECPSLFAVPIV
jgi:hypothetical protein